MGKSAIDFYSGVIEIPQGLGHGNNMSAHKRTVEVQAVTQVQAEVGNHTVSVTATRIKGLSMTQELQSWVRY